MASVCVVLEAHLLIMNILSADEYLHVGVVVRLPSHAIVGDSAQFV